MEPLIRIRNVSKVYGSGPAAVHAVREVDLDVAPGEVLLMMGPSGSGKTTLLSMMGAILRASSGGIRLLGEEIVGVKESKLPDIRRRNIGFIFQGFNLFPALNARENVEEALKLKGYARSQARAEAERLLTQVGLGDRLRHHPADLSGGQKQRVAIARALAGDPRIILADEPTAALDSQSGFTVMEILSTLARDHGRAVVIVTHDSRVLDYGTRMVHIADGRLEAMEAVKVAAV
jgi:putative ABC transport system ATP-binding protein